MTSNRRRTILLVTSALVAGIVVAGCEAARTDKAGSSVAAGGAVAERAPAPQEALDQGTGAVAGDTPAQAPNLGVDQRSIVYRGSSSVRVRDVTEAAAQVTAIAATAGGFIGSDNRTRGNGDDVATMELRVPSAKFAGVVQQLSTLGTEEARQISTEDVTEQTIDLDARITVQQARVDSGRRLLAQAKSLSDLVMLEREVATRESDLASLQAKKRRIADLVALSTITVTLLGPHAAAVTPGHGPGGFLGGLAAGWHALLASLRVLLTVLGAVLPWLLGLGLPAWLIVLLVRRVLRGRRATGPIPVLATATPEPSAPGRAEPPEASSD